MIGYGSNMINHTIPIHSIYVGRTSHQQVWCSHRLESIRGIIPRGFPRLGASDTQRMIMIFPRFAGMEAAKYPQSDVQNKKRSWAKSVVTPDLGMVQDRDTRKWSNMGMFTTENALDLTARKTHWATSALKLLALSAWNSDLLLNFVELIWPPSVSNVLLRCSITTYHTLLIWLTAWHVRSSSVFTSQSQHLSGAGGLCNQSFSSLTGTVAWRI